MKYGDSNDLQKIKRIMAARNEYIYICIYVKPSNRLFAFAMYKLMTNPLWLPYVFKKNLYSPYSYYNNS